MSYIRTYQSFDAGMEAHDQGMPRTTPTNDYFIDRLLWLAGWDEAEAIAQERAIKEND